jgi:hypothetical protein
LAEHAHVDIAAPVRGDANPVQRAESRLKAAACAS